MHRYFAQSRRPATQWRRTAAPAAIAGTIFLSAMLASPAAACDWDAAFADHQISAFAWEAVEDAVDVPARDLLEAAGEIIFAPAAAGGSVDDRLCVEVATSLTCSLGIAVCAFVVIGPEPARAVELVTAAHAMSALPSANSPYPVIMTHISTANGTERTRYEWHGGEYLPR